MRTPVLTAAVAALVAALATPAVARADKYVEALTVWRYDASTYTIDQGERLSFRNSDSASPGPHDVTAASKGTDGRPAFASRRIGAGQLAPVEGAQQLRTGSYEFFCTVHPFMEATLVVSSRGTPLPPGGEQPPVTPPPPGADDTRPAVRAALSPTSLRSAVRRNRVVARVTSDEPVNLRMTLIARVDSRRVVLGRARAGHPDPRGTARVAIRPNRLGRRVFGRARRVAVTLLVEARDAAGNVGSARARRVLKR